MARRTDTRDPRSARLAALRVLHEADVRGEDPLVALERRVAAEAPAERLRATGAADDPELGDVRVDAFARSLVEGVAATRDDLDARIARHARGWKVGRMPVVDRNLLRLAVHELMTEPTPVPVVLDEAVRLAKELSTDDSGRYVNGVLVAVVKELGRTLDAGDAGDAGVTGVADSSGEDADR
ncbi:MAG: transcription antitermination factor NusB [Nitriliruptoraceae bacterium]